MLHRVADESAQVLVRQGGIQPVGRSLHHDVAGIVGHGKVPPVQGRTADAGVHPLHRLAGQVAAHHVARPEHIDGGGERIAIDGQTSFRRGIGPQPGIVRGTDDERSHPFIHLHEVLVQAVQQFGLFVGIGTFARDVVKEDGKRTDAQVVHPVELVYQVPVIFFIPPDVLPRMDGPDEVHPVAVARLHQLADVVRLFFRVRQAPVGTAVIRIVLRAVQVVVHLELAVKVDQRQTHFV